MTLPQNSPDFHQDIIFAKYQHKTPADVWEYSKEKYVESLLMFIFIGSLCCLYALL
jgi:hypothetical protein